MGKRDAERRQEKTDARATDGGPAAREDRPAGERPASESERCDFCNGLDGCDGKGPIGDGEDGSGKVRGHLSCIMNSDVARAPASDAPTKRPIAEVSADYLAAVAAEAEALKPRPEPPEVDARRVAESALARRLHAADASYVVNVGGGSRVFVGRKSREPRGGFTGTPEEADAQRAAFEARRYYLEELPKPKGADDI